MDVICRLGEYSNPSKGEVNIESHLGDHNMIEIVIDGKRYVVCAEESLYEMRLSKSEPNENILDDGRTDGLLDRSRVVSIPNNGWGRT